MPSRVIRESIQTSETLASISSDAERLFWRLVVSADDHGCFYGDPAIILGQAMTAFLRRGVTEEHIASWLEELEEAGLIRRYTVDGRTYLHIITWHRHQRTPRGKPKFPLPPEYNSLQVAASRGESQRPAASRGDLRQVAALYGNRQIENRESSSYTPQAAADDDAHTDEQADGGAAPDAASGGRGDADSPSLPAGSAVALEVAAAVRDADPDLRPVHDAYFEVTGRALMPGRDIETLRELLQIASPEQIAAAIREVGARAREAGTRPRSLRYFADAVREAVAAKKPAKKLDYDLPDPDSEMERRRAERAKWWREQMAAKAKGRAPA